MNGEKNFYISLKNDSVDFLFIQNKLSGGPWFL